MTKGGFFTSEQVSAQKVVKPITRKKTARRAKMDCNKCGLYKTQVLSPKMDYHGRGDKYALIMAQSPGPDEDEQGKQLVGKAGQGVRKALEGIGLKLERDFWRTNAINCFISPHISVYTADGYKPIRNVQVGEQVLTHKGRFRKVLSRIHDLPKSNRTNVENLYEIFFEGENKRFKNQTKKGSFTITKNHLLLTDKGWTAAKDLIIGTSIMALGEKCSECECIYFKNPYTFDSKESTCSVTCHNTRASKKGGQKRSETFKKLYKDGILDGKTITKKAHQRVRGLVKDRKWGHQTWNNDKATAKKAKNRERYNKLYKGIIVGEGEEVVAKFLQNHKIPFIHQFNIGKRNFDFFLPRHNLVLEIENPISYKSSRKLKDERFKERREIVENHGSAILFIPSNDPIPPIQRILKNHSGEYCFTKVKVAEITIRPPNPRKPTLYCLEVEEDHSFIAAGVVHHNCYPGKDKDGDFKKPTTTQINCCREVKIRPQLEKLKPEVVVLMGNEAIQSYWGDRGIDISRIKVTQLRGKVVPDREGDCWVFHSYHSSFIARLDYDENLQALWRRDFKLLKDVINKWDMPEFRDPKPLIRIITDFHKATELLESILETPPPFLVFDYETSGLKPHRGVGDALPHHMIHSISLAMDGEAYSFPFQYPGHFTKQQQEEIAHLWVKILESNTPKIAHNLKFEDIWSRVILNCKPGMWKHDTMVCQHILDNQRYTTGLKAQAWLRYGIGDYDSEFKNYRGGVLLPDEVEFNKNKNNKTKKKASSYHYNRVHEMPLEDLLLYGGMDAILEYWLYEDQLKELNGGLTKAQAFFHDALVELCDVQDTGIWIDDDWYDSEETRLLGEVADLDRKIFASREAKLFAQDKGHPIDLGSNDDLKYLFFKLLGMIPPKYTDLGNESVDAEALGSLDNPVAQRIVTRRKKLKILHTYIDGFRRESADGKIYPIINLHIPTTYRSSCDNPNFQNLPKREEEPKKAVRTGVVASEGNKLLELDFGGIEVCGWAWYSQDKALLKYLHNPESNMHRDQAKIIFDIPDDDWDAFDEKAVKLLRFYTKNQWVFPLVYGSYYKTCASNIWDHCSELPIGDDDGTIVRQWLEMSFDTYVRFLKRKEKEFWKQFQGVRDWQNDLAKEYRRKGYVETKMGFRLGGYLSRNELYNYPIQGTAFHLLLWSLIQANRERKNRGWKSRIIMQVHDSLILDLVPKEQREVVSVVRDIMENRTRETFPWINTPLTVEPEITAVNGTLNDLKGLDDEDEEFMEAA